MNPPLFVVVGHVNRGKSSIVSTLAADDSVEIDPMPGTTADCNRYRMRIGESILLEFVDTPDLSDRGRCSPGLWSMKPILRRGLKRWPHLSTCMVRVKRSQGSVH